MWFISISRRILGGLFPQSGQIPYKFYFYLFILSILHQSLFGSSENGRLGLKISLILKSMTFFELKLWSHINCATHIAGIQRQKHRTVMELPDFVNEDETSIKQICQKSETAGLKKSTVGFMVKKNKKNPHTCSLLCFQRLCERSISLRPSSTCSACLIQITFWSHPLHQI